MILQELGGMPLADSNNFVMWITITVIIIVGVLVGNFVYNTLFPVEKIDLTPVYQNQFALGVLDSNNVVQLRRSLDRDFNAIAVNQQAIFDRLKYGGCVEVSREGGSIDLGGGLTQRVLLVQLACPNKGEGAR